MPLVVRPSPIHSVGVYTTTAIRKGSRVIEYTGERITPLNHSCEPNCEVDEIKGRVWLFALRDIAPGEELVWDYNLYDDEDPAPCYCGSRKCRGTMYSREWMAKIRRREARKKKKLEAARNGKTSNKYGRGNVPSDAPAPSRVPATPQ